MDNVAIVMNKHKVTMKLNDVHGIASLTIVYEFVINYVVSVATHGYYASNIATGMVRDRRKYAFNSLKIRFLHQTLNYPPMPLISENNGSSYFLVI
jgi:hypothetical protein